MVLIWPYSSCLRTTARLLAAAASEAFAAFSARRIGFNRPERIRDVLEGADHRAAILRVGLIEFRFGLLLFMQQRAGIEDGLRDVAAKRVERGRRHEEIRQIGGARASLSRQADERQPVGGRDADQGAGGIQIGLGGADVGTVLHESRGQAYRQRVRELERSQFEFLDDFVVGILPGQRGQEVAVEPERFFQRRKRLFRLRESRLLRAHRRRRPGRG